MPERLSLNPTTSPMPNVFTRTSAAYLARNPILRKWNIFKFCRRDVRGESPLHEVMWRSRSCVVTSGCLPILCAVYHHADMHQAVESIN